MKILLTGCAGFIGFHVAKHLAQAAHELIVIDSSTTIMMWLSNLHGLQNWA